jgi:hypothetical protein
MCAFSGFCEFETPLDPINSAVEMIEPRINSDNVVA